MGRLTGTLDRVGAWEALDPVVARVQPVVRRMLPPGPLRDMLNGVPVGHPAHPALAQVPLGAWLSAAFLDLMPGRRTASTALIGLGTVAALPAVAAGAADWSELHPQQQRVGLVHSAANLLATGFYAMSFVERLRGRSASGKRLAFAGLAVASLGGYIGGHLAYRQASGVNHAEDVPHRFPVGWQAVCPLTELPEEQLTHRLVAEEPVLLYRRGEQIFALSNTCSHLSGPLSDGTVEPDGELCVVCPWHGSGFSLRDGTVLRGPATSPQPAFSVRVIDGVVELMLEGAG